MSRITQFLIDARALVEAGWIQGHPRSLSGPPCYCVDGAVIQTTLNWWTSPFRPPTQAQYDDRDRVYEAIRSVIDGEPLLSMWNDQPERTQADVLAAFDRAIEACR